MSNIETRGTETRMPPIIELFFEISEIATIDIADIATLIM